MAILVELNRQITQLETALAEHFEQHPDADIYLSLPGLGVVLGARVLGEFGDDPDRYADVKSRRNYAGTSPLTIASGKHPNRDCPLHPQQPALRRHLPVGLLVADRQPRMPTLLRPTKNKRRYPRPSPQNTRQPSRRDPPRMPQNPNPLQRTDSLGVTANLTPKPSPLDN